MKLGSLFSGIGGIDLAFERAGFEIAWQVEIDRQARSVLGCSPVRGMDRKTNRKGAHAAVA